MGISYDGCEAEEARAIPMVMQVVPRLKITKLQTRQHSWCAPLLAALLHSSPFHLTYASPGLQGRQLFMIVR